MQSSPTLTVKELATEFKLAKSTIYALVANGQLPHVRFGTAIRFRRDAVEAWLESQERFAEESQISASEEVLAKQHQNKNEVTLKEVKS